MKPIDNLKSSIRSKKVKKCYLDMTNEEKESEIKRLEKKKGRSRFWLKFSIPFTVISVIATIIAVVFYIKDRFRLINLIIVETPICFAAWILALVTMIICVNVFIPVYWCKSIVGLFSNVIEEMTYNHLIDFILGAIFVGIPVSIVILATFVVPGVYCLARLMLLKSTIFDCDEIIMNIKESMRQDVEPVVLPLE